MTDGFDYEHDKWASGQADVACRWYDELESTGVKNMRARLQDIVGVQVRHHLRGRRDGRDCSWIYKMEVARMQLGRMHTDQRDCVPRIVNGDHRIALGIVMIADRSRQLA
jgi:hypothetical protein